jgi:hypothetical protein
MTPFSILVTYQSPPREGDFGVSVNEVHFRRRVSAKQSLRLTF